ncbi:MAG: CheR family methyltransferase [Thermoanaerobaculales bacterium]
MSVASAEAAALAALVEKVSGNVVPPGNLRFLAEIAFRRAVALGLDDVGAYERALARGDLADEWRWLLPHITVKESYLFRTPQQFAALAATILPALASAREHERTLLVWSAGCARGEEPATLAVVLAEQSSLVGWDWRILATDVDEDALAAGRLARFGERAVAQVPPALLARYFARQDGAFQLHPQLLQRIEFRALNLVREPFSTPGRPFDLIFLRNVMIYFRIESQRRVAAAAARSLAPDGYLFLGPAETLWQLSEELEPVDLEGCFCYRHAPPRTADDRKSNLSQLLPRKETSAIRPVEGHQSNVPPANPPGGDSASGRPNEVKAVGGQATARPLRVGTQELVAEAARHVADNRFADAVTVIERALLADPTDPAAHALEGLLHDLSSRTQKAFASYRAALFLDEELFQVRLLLADALRRLGDTRRAEQEYRRVLATLAGGRPRALDSLAVLPLPTRDQAQRRCRQALRYHS